MVVKDLALYLEYAITQDDDFSLLLFSKRFAVQIEKPSESIELFDLPVYFSAKKAEDGYAVELVDYDTGEVLNSLHCQNILVGEG